MLRHLVMTMLALMMVIVAPSLAVAHDPSDSRGPHVMTAEVLMQRLKAQSFVVDGPIIARGATYRVKGTLQGNAKELVIDRGTGTTYEMVAGRLQRTILGSPKVKGPILGSRIQRAAEIPAAEIVRQIPRSAVEIVEVPVD